MRGDAATPSVVVLSEQYHPKVGGAVRYVDGLVRGLLQVGARVTLVVPSTRNREANTPNRSSLPKAQRSRLDVIRIEARGDVHGAWSRGNRRRFVRDVAALLEDRLPVWEPTVVHVAYGHFLYSAMQDIPGTPTFWTVHNVPPAESQGWLGRGTGLSDLARSLLARGYGLASGAVNRMRIARSACDCIIAVSPHVADKVTPWAIGSDVRVVGEGFSGDCCRPEGRKGGAPSRVRGGDLSVLTVAGLAPHKGQHMGLEAAEHLRRAGVSFEWKLVGPVRDRDYAARLREQMEQSGLDGRVRLAGAVSDEELCELYGGADVYVQTSVEEGYCLSVLEALAHGTPVVGSPTGAIGELVSAGAGRVVERADGALFARAIRSLKGEEWPRSRRLGLARRTRAEFSWTAVAEKMVEAYRAYA